MKRGIATFTLDHGQCPRWLFERMVKLGQKMIEVIVTEYSPEEFIKRLADPVWFQSLGTVLAFDWNASGLTTVLTAALKQAVKNREKDLGVFICGGKGKTSRKTPQEIENWGEQSDLGDEKTQALVYNSKMTAKIDNSLIQDGYQTYHHCFFFTQKGAWTVVQQGMNTYNQTARRYHWFSENIKDLVCEPHTGIISEKRGQTLNLTAKKSQQTRALSTELVNSSYNSLIKDVCLLSKYYTPLSQMIELRKSSGEELKLLNLEKTEFEWHPVVLEDFSQSKYLKKDSLPGL